GLQQLGDAPLSGVERLLRLVDGTHDIHLGTDVLRAFLPWVFLRGSGHLGFTSVAEALKPGRESRRPRTVGRWCRWPVAQFVRFGVLRAVVGPAVSVDNHLLPLPGR